MQRILAVLAAAILAMGFFALSPLKAEEPFDAETKAAIAGIQSAPFFAIGGVGFAGSLSPGEKQLHVLLRRKEKAALLKLTNDKSDIARLYGLTGLRYLEAPEYKTAAKGLLASKEIAPTCRGCNLGKEPVADITRQIVKGEFNAPIKERMKHP